MHPSVQFIFYDTMKESMNYSIDKAAGLFSVWSRIINQASCKKFQHDYNWDWPWATNKLFSSFYFPVGFMLTSFASKSTIKTEPTNLIVHRRELLARRSYLVIHNTRWTIVTRIFCFCISFHLICLWFLPLVYFQILLNPFWNIFDIR